MLRQILEYLRQNALFHRDAGDGFERLVCAYLKLDPQYVELFRGVWLWKDWPEREALGFKLPDTGIDLVAKLRDKEGYCAIQCKFYDSSIAMDDLGSFFTLSGKGGFALRFIVATAPLTQHAANALEGQQIETQLNQNNSKNFPPKCPESTNRKHCKKSFRDLRHMSVAN